MHLKQNKNMANHLELKICWNLYAPELFINKCQVSRFNCRPLSYLLIHCMCSGGMCVFTLGSFCKNVCGMAPGLVDTSSGLDV